jgi:uncharacterized membrane protein YcaP (DUF421 family)
MGCRVAARRRPARRLRRARGSGERGPNLDSANLRRAGITRADLDAILRRHGYHSANEVRLALYEAKGSVSIFDEKTGPPG